MSISLVIVITLSLIILLLLGIRWHQRRIDASELPRQEPELNAQPTELDESVEWVRPVAQTPHDSYRGDTRQNDAESTSSDVQRQPDPPSVSQKSASFEDAPLVITLLAEKDSPYEGYGLLQALLLANLRCRKDVFHRYDKKQEEGQVLFTLASAKAPGTFNLQQMGNFSTPGLCLILQPDRVDNPVYALELMVATARQLVDELGGRMLDQSGQPVTQATLKHWCNQFTHADIL